MTHMVEGQSSGPPPRRLLEDAVSAQPSQRSSAGRTDGDELRNGVSLPAALTLSDRAALALTKTTPTEAGRWGGRLATSQGRAPPSPAFDSVH